MSNGSSKGGRRRRMKGDEANKCLTLIALSHQGTHSQSNNSSNIL
jgi:hypothetical protein